MEQPEVQSSRHTDMCKGLLTLMIWCAPIWFGGHVFDLVTYFIWCAGSTCAQERGCTDGGYLVCTEAQKSTRKRTRAHRQGSIRPVLQRKCCQQLQTGTACLSRETNMKKHLHQAQCFKNYFKSPTSPLHMILTIRRAIVCNPEKLHIGVLAFCRW